MAIGFLGLLCGILIGFYFPGYIPKAYSVYVAMALLAAADSIVGGLAAKIENKYDDKIFVSGFCINTLLAAALTYVGKLLAIDLTIAAIVVFGSRLFQNFAKIRRLLLNYDKQ
ncbi:MAG: small basic family protein [Bacillota bacterium]|nr:small basic family protein [Bacillota bacterium]